MLRAFFDESGIHAGSPVTFVAGFIGSSEEWAEVRAKWQSVMNGEVFHYKNMRADERLDQLADILATSRLQVVSAGFSGDWKQAISHKPDWKRRFPSCYHFVFEACIEQMERWTTKLWQGQSIALVFSQQHEYAKRAEEVWRTFRGNGYWKNFVSFSYDHPDLPELQAADMVTYETFQCIKAGTEEAWHRWPLAKRLLKNNVPLYGGYHTPETFVAMMEHSERNGRIFLKNVPKNI